MCQPDQYPPYARGPIPDRDHVVVDASPASLDGVGMNTSTATAPTTDPLILAQIELEAAAAAEHEVWDRGGNPAPGTFAAERLARQLRRPQERTARAILAFAAEHDAAFGR